MKMDFISKKFKIYMLPVKEGDCFFVQVPVEDKMFYMMIDTGPVSSWEETLKPFWENLMENQIDLDLLVITHIDSDHIGGAIKLLENNKLRKHIKEIWYNGLRYMQQETEEKKAQSDFESCRVACERLAENCYVAIREPNESISTKEAVTLTELITGANIPWNTNFKGAVVEGVKSYTIAPNVSIDILLPTLKSLNKLRKRFLSEVNACKMGTRVVIMPESEKAFELMALNDSCVIYTTEAISERKNNICNIKKWAEQTPKPDKSLTNATSIAFCLTYHDKTFLFTGDAIEEDLIAALKKWKEKQGKTLYFDVIKIPHHGSYHNNMRLLDYIDGEYFLLSTDGIKFRHPDKETIAKIVTRPKNQGDGRKIVFNYENEMFRLFSDEAAQVALNYRMLKSNELAGVNWETSDE